MSRELRLFALFLALGAVLRVVAFRQLEWFFDEHLRVDEATYVEGDTPPFARPPGTYLLAGVSGDVKMLRFLFALVSFVPALSLFFFRERSMLNSLVAGALAIEPTLAFAGLQILPAVPAAAFVSVALTAGSKKPLLAGWFIGCAALFRGELLVFIPLALFFVRPLRRYLLLAGGFFLAVLPVFTVNYLSGGQFALAENGPLNVWIGSSWELLRTPPGMEYEQLMNDDSFADNAFDSVAGDFTGWIGRGFVKSAVFLSVPGPGRNIEAPDLLRSSVLWLLLPVTFLFLTLGLSGVRRNTETAFLLTGFVAAFIFFPSIRHRVVFLPALAASAATFRPKRVPVPAAVVLAASLIPGYPAEVRPGLNDVIVAQGQLEDGNYEACFRSLDHAEAKGFQGADIHNIRGACIASSGGSFHDAAEELGLALRMVPGAYTAWKNMAALLWNYGYSDDAVYAAERAVSLNPELRSELSVILEQRR